MTNSIEYDRIADIYDLYVQTLADVPFFLEQARESSGDVLELMAGTGRVSLPLIEAGIPVTCVDNSQQMIAVLQHKLRDRGLTGSVEQADIRQLSLNKRFSLVIIPFNSFSEILSVEDQRCVLGRVRSHLADDGRFICTVHNPVVRLKSVDSRLHLYHKTTSPDGRVLQLWIQESIDLAVNIVNGVEFFEEYDLHGVMQSRRLLEFRFRVMSKCDFENLARFTGFKVVALYGDYTCTPYQEDRSPYMIWVLEKDSPNHF